MKNLTKNTTKKHYEKFRDMAKVAGLTYRNSNTYMGFTKTQLLELYLQDNNLNNIPLRDFDCIYLHLPSYTRKIITNLADNCCVYKHLLIYEVLETTPIFTDIPLNLRD